MTDTLTLDISIKKVAQSRLPETNFEDLKFGRTFSDHIFVADYEDGKWQKPRILPFGELTLTPASSSLHYGQTIFEGLKAYKSNQNEVLVFRPDQNWERFNISAMRMCMPTVPEDIFLQGLDALLDLDKGWIPPQDGSSLYIRPFMYAADEFMGMRPSETYKFVILTCPVGKYYTQPVKVKVETQYSRACEGGTGYAKTGGNYGASMQPAKNAQKLGYDQLLWTDAKSHEYIEESGTMNVMFVINDVLITPSTSDTILAGITRKSVLQLAKDMGVDYEERRISVKEIIWAIEKGNLQEAFGVGTAATIAPIDTIAYQNHTHQLQPLKEGSLAMRFLNALEDIRRGRSQDIHDWVRKV